VLHEEDESDDEAGDEGDESGCELSDSLFRNDLFALTADGDGDAVTG
jgi:hypothetical protein